MKTQSKFLFCLFLSSALLLTAAFSRPTSENLFPLQQGGGSDPPGEVVKLIFIHHSTGENWLTDGYGNLGTALAENNYFVSDTNYGWGPDGIGDRTDIPDWQEWFSSSSTARYMEALYNENGQNASYARNLADPGGENEIIMFKSCFPNSDLEGSPNDPPSEDGWLSVGHAKYVYNQILKYFQNHPEKLFVVITAPPLSDRSNAANARAFNQWLMYDWLAENDYPFQNVAVFDFYNVLTGKDGHHTFENGQEVHQVASKNTLYYPSGDDHPSKKGSQKATDEFIPLLNYFYSRWQAGNPAPLLSPEGDPPVDSSQPDENKRPAAAPELSGLIDNFEGEPPAGTGGWETYWDEGTTSQLTCTITSEAGADGSVLELDYQISAYSWGTCGLSYDQAQNWSGFQGLVFSLHAQEPGQILNVDLYADGPDGKESYLYEVELGSAQVEGWVQIGVPWEEFRRVEWEEGAGMSFNKSDQVSGLAFGFGTEENELAGTLWIDNLGWMEESGSALDVDNSQPQVDSEPPEQPEQSSGRGPCFPLMALPVGAAGMVLYWRKRRS